MAYTRLPVALILTVIFVLVFLPSPATAFGAGNIASISKIEGHNWRHGDIEDTLRKIAFIRGHKWTSMMVKRVYFGNWLRDYSQALDVGTLKSVQAGTIRILVWVLSFLSFGYATGEFEVTEERLGVYRPEEHIDNPKDYADNMDARRFDPRLRGPVQRAELEIDPNTGMKNYIANESGGWATSSGYVKHSLSRSIHFGRVYTSGAHGAAGKEADLCEALRCLGQALHCMEDFGAHSTYFLLLVNTLTHPLTTDTLTSTGIGNYVELALRELGFSGVFPHTGTATEINLYGHKVFPLVTGSFGVVDFLHSVIGEVTDNFAASEVNELDLELSEASELSKKKKPSGPSSDGSARGFGSNTGQDVQYLTTLLSQIPGGVGLCQQAEKLQADADAREFDNLSLGTGSRGVDEYYGTSRAPGTGMPSFDAPPGTAGGPPAPGIPGMSPNFDPVKTAAQIYPILEFRDRVAKVIAATIEKIPGLEMLVEKITETLTVFILSLLAPFIRPIINAISKQLQEGSSGIVQASGKNQYEPWNNPNCTDPTHRYANAEPLGAQATDIRIVSFLKITSAINLTVSMSIPSKTWSNPASVPSEPAGQVAAAILAYVVPRVLYAWEHPQIPEQQILNDAMRVFHHPAIRDQKNELHRNMFDVVQRWTNQLPDRGASLNKILGSDGVKKGLNHSGDSHDHGLLGIGSGKIHGYGSHSKVSGSEWEKRGKRKDKAGKTRDIGEKGYGGSGSAGYGADDYYDGGKLRERQVKANSSSNRKWVSNLLFELSDQKHKEHKEQKEHRKEYKKEKKSERDKYYSDEGYGDDGSKKRKEKKERHRDEDSDSGDYKKKDKHKYKDHKKYEHKHHSSSGGHRGLDLSGDEEDVPTGYGTYDKSHKSLEPNPPYPEQKPPEQDFGYYAPVATPQYQDSASYPSQSGAAPLAGVSREPYGNYQYGSTYSGGQHHYQNPNRPPSHEGEQGSYPQARYGGPPYPADPDAGYPGYGYRYGEAGQGGYGGSDGRRG